MKKFLSFILVLAMVLGCVSMVSFASEAKSPVGASFTTVEAKEKYDLAMWGKPGDGSVAADNASYNGNFTLSYYVYNASDSKLTLEVLFANKDGKSAKDTTDAYEKRNVWPGGMELFTITLNVAEGNASFLGKDGIEYTQTLNNLRLRMYPEFATQAAGNTFYVIPADGNADDGIITKFTDDEVTKELLYEMPESKGVKLTAIADQPTNGYDIVNWNQGVVFNKDDTFTGDLVKKYTVYNTSNKQLKVGLRLATIDKHGDGLAGEYGTITEVVIPAGEKANISISAPVINGVVTINDTVTRDIDLVTVRWTLLFTNGGSNDSCIIAPCGDDIHGNQYYEYMRFYAEDDATPKMTVEKVTELPDQLNWAVTGLEIVSAPEKTVYAYGEPLNLEGLIVNAVYEDGSRPVTISTENISGFDSTKSGEQTVIVSYAGKTATFTVSVNKAVSNGDAENGTTNWDAYNGGSIVSETESNGNKVIKFTPTGLYGSIQFDIGPAIIQDAAKNLAGSGAGYYKISFRTKAEAGHSGTFKVTLVTWRGTTVTGGTNKVDNTIYNGENELNVKDTWTEHTLYVNVSDAFLNTVAQSNAPSQISFRLDGNNRAYGSTGALTLFSYYMDDVTIEYIKDAPTKLGYKITFDEDLTSNYDLQPAGLTTSMIQTDETTGAKYIRKSYNVYNKSNHTVKIEFYLQASSGHQIKNVKRPGVKDIPAYSYLTFTTTIPVNDDNTVTCDKGHSYQISNIYLRYTYADSNRTQYDTLYFEEVSETGTTASFPASNENRHKYYNAVYEKTDFSQLGAASLNIGSSLGMDIAAVIGSGVDKDNIKLNVTRYYANNKAVVTELSPASYVDGCAMFEYTGINAQCMADEIKFELLIDGKVVSTIYEYSVKQYAVNRYDEDNNPDTITALDDLLRDMLVYGAEAQKKIGYRDDALVTEGVSWAVLDYYYDAPEYVRVIENNNETSGVASATLNISYVNKVRFTLVDASQVKSVTINGVEAEIEGNYVYSDAIKATEFGKVFELVVTAVDDQVITVRYNANAYIATKMATSPIAKALNNYGQSAVAYNG